MNRSAIICFLILGMIVAASAQYGGGYGYQPHYETHEKRFLSVPIPHLKINLDKLTIPLPNLMSLFSSSSSNHHDDDDDDEHYYPPPHY